MHLTYSYNQANTQTALLTDVREKLSLAGDDPSVTGNVSVLSARSIRNSARSALPYNALASSPGSSGSVIGAENVHTHGSHALYVDFASATSMQHRHHQSLKAVLAEERKRRGEDAHRRTGSIGSDYRSLCYADVRSSKLLYQTTKNLSALEIQLGEEDSREQDKARIVFVKMLRERLTKESNMLAEKAKMYSRMQQQETQSERYLQHLEEAMALSATSGTAEGFNGGGIDGAQLGDHNNPDDRTVKQQQDVGALVKRLVARHITELQTRMQANIDRLELAVNTLFESLDKEHQECVERHREAQRQEQALLGAEMQANDKGNAAGTATYTLLIRVI